MKRLFLALGLLMVWTATAVAQQNCVDLQEIDGSPRAPCVKKILVTNGTLTCSSTNVCTLTTGGGSGSPGGLAGQVQWNDTGAFNGTSGLTATATTVTIVSGVTATFSRAGLLYTGTVTTDNASVQTMLLQGDRATPTGNDEAYITYRLSNVAGTQTEVARVTWAIPTATAASEDGRIDWSVMTGGALAKKLQLSGADLAPSTNDGLALGTTVNQFSDLFLASGGVIDFAGGNVVLTHSSGILTMGTGELRITTPGTNAASVPTLGSSSILSNKTLATGTIFAGYSDIAEIAAPANPSAGSIRLYADSGTGDLACLNSAGGSCLPTGGGSPGGSDTQLQYNNASSFGGISGATSNGTNVTFGSGNLLATSPIFSTDITTPIVKSAAGDALAMNATAPVAANGASQVGKNITVTASAAVASLDTAGAAAGGSVTITSGAAARLTSGNADGGDINLVTGAGIGTGTAGQILIPSGVVGAPAIAFSADPTLGFFRPSAGALVLGVGGTSSYFLVNSAQFRVASGISYGISSSATDPVNNAADVLFRRAAAANWAFGAADAASPVAQTLSVQNATGTDAAGANWTFAGSRGTGTGIGGSIIFQTAPAGSTGSSQNALVTAFTVPSTGGFILPEVSTPGTPSSNTVVTYAKDNGSGISKLYYKGDDGVEVGPLGTGGGGSPAGSTGDYQINSGGAFAAGVLVQGSTGRLTATPTLQTSGTASYFRLIGPADTGQTASTEAIGAQFGGNTSAATVTRQWATGALTTQRENLFVAPTYAFVGASTLTTAINVEAASPIVGTNATFTNAFAARFIASAAAHTPLVVKAAGSQSADLIRGVSSADANLFRVGSDGIVYTASINNIGATATRIRFPSGNHIIGMVLNGVDYLYFDGNASPKLAYMGNGDVNAAPAAGILQGTGGSGSNIAGGALNFNGGQGTGTGLGGSIVFKTAPAGSSGSSLNALVTAMTIQSDGVVVHKSVTFSNLPTVVNGGVIYCSDCTLASPCASGGSGALAKGINGAWVCN